MVGKIDNRITLFFIVLIGMFVLHILPKFIGVKDGSIKDAKILFYLLLFVGIVCASFFKIEKEYYHSDFKTLKQIDDDTHKYSGHRYKQRKRSE